MFFKKKYQGVLIIDVHDVLSTLQDFKIRQGLIYAKKFSYKLENPNQVDTKQIFAWPLNVDEDFWRLNLPQFLNGIGPKVLAPEALYKLHDMGYKIILYHDPLTLELSKEMLEYHHKHILKWCHKYRITYDTFIESTNDLLNIMKTYKGTIFISANKQKIEHVATSYQTILFDTNYNQGLDGVHITRVRDWKEAYQMIKNNHLN